MTLLHTNGSLNGLIESDAADRLRSKGKNEVAHDKAPHAFVQLAYAFRNPFVVILLVLAGISYCTDVYFASSDERDWNSVIILLVMVIVSSLLRFFQEYRSNRAAERLKSMVCSTATVVRRTSKTAKPVRRKVLLSSLVVGDIVDLQAGDMIPADVRLIDSRNFMVSQAALTGEALPVEKYDTLGAVMQKSATRISKESRDPLELPNICFMGTNVFSGSATAVVVETGANTYFGTLAKIVISRKRIETSFDRGVNSVSWLLIRFMLVMVPVVFLLNGVTKGDWLSALTFALAVAVGLTPEMLPMIVSANLAKGAIAMSRRKVVVKRLNSVQNFGAMDVLCTDKTGTLTQDRIILEHHLNVNGVRDDRILEFAWLNSFHQRGQKNCMDMAIVEQAEKSGLSPVLNRYRKVDELPFDFERRRVSVVLEHEAGSQLMVCKGAVEEMLDVCTSFQEDSGVRALDQFERAALLTRSQVYNEQGYRVLLIATREIPPDDVKTHFQPGDERELVVRGLLTFLDPPKDSAALAIRALNEHRISVKVLTGDNPIVTAKVCRDVGLEPGTPLLGRDIEDMTDTELDAAVERTTVFAKLTPLQKSRVVNAFQANGHTVGFLGDGINDAAALRDADVGISVDTGSDIAKETADIILLEKDLMVLEQGVITGRQTFGNILKYLNMTASSNFGNVFSVLIASAFLPWEPMLAVQLLIQNLIYDLSQMFLPWDKMDSEFLAKPRKWEAGNIRRFMIWFGPTSSVFDITTFWLLWTVFGAGATYYANGGGQIIMNSGWFVEGLVSQTLVVHMLRTQRIPFFQSMAALPVMLSTTVAIFVACWLPYSPFAQALGFQALDHRYWGWLIATIVAYMLLAQAVKTVYIRRYRRWY
ncbi:magnesium-translocating P-type ATPase [Caballeronia sp. HLA56]